jgi:hypothetical protein
MTTTTTMDETFFRQAVERYIDEDKPDTLRQRQIESWRFAWRDDDVDAADPATTDTSASTDALLFVPDHCISGTLTWTGEYVTIQFHCSSYWKEEEQQPPPGEGKKNGKKNEPQEQQKDDGGGRFVAKCHVAQATLRDDLSKEQLKVQQKLSKRWKKDAAVSALFATGAVTDGPPIVVELFDVSIVVAPQSSDNEQRSYWNENCCAALRTILYTTAESSLEVFELIVRYLPTVIMSHHPPTTTSGSSSSQATTTTITKLADRAILRLLEDATYDACAAEDSDTAEESLEELHLDHPNDTDDDDNDDDNKKKKAKRRKRG